MGQVKTMSLRFQRCFLLPLFVGFSRSECRAHASGCVQELEELREQWGTTLDPQTLRKLFEFLLARRVKKHKYRFAEIFD